MTEVVTPEQIMQAVEGLKHELARIREPIGLSQAVGFAIVVLGGYLLGFWCAAGKFLQIWEYATELDKDSEDSIEELEFKIRAGRRWLQAWPMNTFGDFLRFQFCRLRLPGEDK